jgi:hypothetical protein
MVWLPEPEREEALALRGAAPFDPMGPPQRLTMKKRAAR